MCYGKVLKMGKLDGSLSYGGSATCSIWTGVLGSEIDSGKNETVYCWLLKAGESIASGTRVFISLIDGYWQVTAAACP